MTEEKPELGPADVSFATFLLKLIAGAAGGILGSLLLLLIFVLASSIMSPITNSANFGEYVSPIFVFILLMMVFLSSTVGNILSIWLLALTERSKYTRISSAIYQIFIISIVVFLLMVPVYFITASSDLRITAFAVALHIIITAQVSALILEIVSNPKYTLVGLYGVTFSIIVAAAVMFFLSGIVESPQILLFAALPVVWGSIAFVQTVFTMLYGWIARTYDKDFLSTQTEYGDDYGEEEVEEEDKTPKAKDEEGGDFLRHN